MSNLSRYRIKYRDIDPSCPEFTMVVCAYDTQHAEEKFWDCGADGDDGWVIISIEYAGKVSMHTGI